MPSIATRGRQMGAHSRTNALKNIRAILGAGGVDYAIIPIGDSRYENAARTTVTTIGSGGGEGLVFTYSEARTSFDVKTRYRPNQLLIPDVSFNGTDEEADSPSAAFWSRISLPFSIGCWVNLVDAASSTFLSKYDSVGDTREWVFYTGGASTFRLAFYDESASGNPSIQQDASDTLPENVWVFLVVTCNGSDDPSGIFLFQNGILISSGETDNVNFVALEALAGTVKLGHFNASPTALLDGRMLGGILGPFFRHGGLSLSQIKRLYHIGMVAQK